MESTATTQHVVVFRGFCLGARDFMLAQAFKIMMDQGLFAMRVLCAARRVSPWIGIGREEGVFSDRLPPLSSSTSEISTTSSTPREHAQYGLRGDRVGEAEDPGPMMRRLFGHFSAQKMLSYQETWVCTLQVLGHKFSFHSPVFNVWCWDWSS